MALVKIREVIGTSDMSFEQAIDQILEYIKSDIRNASGIEIVSQKIKLIDNKPEYRVVAKYAYKWEK
jgi:flavin-binding protein dodecin